MVKKWTEDSLLEKLQNITIANPLCRYTRQRCQRLAPIINQILELKEEKNAIILAHSYVHSDIVYGVADYVGDSYELAKYAKNIDKNTILFSAVRFMTETAKIINPDKLVIDPNPNSNCSLADSISESEVYRLREKYSNHTFVCYINTTAAIKAACDVCVTSANAVKIIERLPSDKIYFLPDKLMGENIKNYLKKNKIDKEFVYYSGTCHVHEEYESSQIDLIRSSFPHAVVLAHPECNSEVIAKSDVVGSTSQMISFVKSNREKNAAFLVLTECGILTRLQVEMPDVKIVGSCMLCKYMRANSLEEIKRALQDPQKDQVVEIDKTIIKNAKRALDAMFYYAM